MLDQIKKQCTHGLKKEAKLFMKAIKHETTSNDEIHEVRVFFKKLKAYCTLMGVLGDEKFKLSDELSAYYTAVGEYRDTKQFWGLCQNYDKKYNLHDSLLLLGVGKVGVAKKNLKKYYTSLDKKELLVGLKKLLRRLARAVETIHEDMIVPGVETFLAQQEGFIVNLLSQRPVADVSLHEIRKRIKKMMYILHCVHEKGQDELIKKHKLYVDLGEELGERNDFNNFSDTLIKYPRDEKVLEIVQIIEKKEHKKKKKLLRKLYDAFHVDAQLILDNNTQWRNDDHVQVRQDEKQTKNATSSPKSSNHPKPGLEIALMKDDVFIAEGGDFPVVVQVEDYLQPETSFTETSMKTVVKSGHKSVSPRPKNPTLSKTSPSRTTRVSGTRKKPTGSSTRAPSSKKSTSISSSRRQSPTAKKSPSKQSQHQSKPRKPKT